MILRKYSGKSRSVLKKFAFPHLSWGGGRRLGVSVMRDPPFRHLIEDQNLTGVILNAQWSECKKLPSH